MSSEKSSRRPDLGKTVGKPSPNRILLWMALLLAVFLSVLFFDSFNPELVHFSNDGPHGQVSAEQAALPSVMFGVWHDLNWLGNEDLMPSPNISLALCLFTSPHTYGRFLYPLAMFIVGLGACYFFRKLELAPVACILGGLAAGLNSEFLSTACWGVASQIIGFGAMYVALGLITNRTGYLRWQKTILAGMAIGLGVMEAYDIGALFSLVVAAYVIYQSVFLEAEPQDPGKSLSKGFVRLAVVSIFAAFITTHTLDVLVGTQIKGIVGMGQDTQTKESRWSEATIWSLPKIETLQVFIPGIFGYRMASPEGRNYWGNIGRSPGLDQADTILSDPNASQAERDQLKAKAAFGTGWRFSGTGYYVGIPVILLALWAILQSFRGDRSPFTISQRRAIWFWTFFAAISIPLAWGKYAPFYRLWYSLPYTSVIRNPTKFMHVFTWVTLILFTYGVHGIYQSYTKPATARVKGLLPQFKNLFKGFEGKFLIGCIVLWLVGLAGWWSYSSHLEKVIIYMVERGVPADVAPSTAAFSVTTVGWFIGVLAATILFLALVFSGQFSGSRTVIGGIFLAMLVSIDLIHADLPWPLYWNLAYKYASNPVVDLFREKPYEQRVELNPFRGSSPQMNSLQQLFDIEWHQQLFPIFNIPSLKVVMEPRLAEDKKKFLVALPYPNLDLTKIIRTWELTSTRYLIGNGGDAFVNAMNRQMDPKQQRFKMVKFPDGHNATFRIEQKQQVLDTSLAAYTAVPDPNGELGVVEFTGALPRASLFANWQANLDDDSTLRTITDNNFDVHQTVVVADESIPKPGTSVSTNSPGTVTINPNYRSKRIELQADVNQPAILMLTDRYNPKWQVLVDGKPAKLLRCDFILRGVYLDKGKHTVVMKYATPLTTLYISLGAVVIGLALAGWVIFSRPFTKSQSKVGTSDRTAVSSLR